MAKISSTSQCDICLSFRGASFSKVLAAKPIRRMAAYGPYVGWLAGGTLSSSLPFVVGLFREPCFKLSYHHSARLAFYPCIGVRRLSDGKWSTDASVWRGIKSVLLVLFMITFGQMAVGSCEEQRVDRSSFSDP